MDDRSSYFGKWSDSLKFALLMSFTSCGSICTVSMLARVFILCPWSLALFRKICAIFRFFWFISSFSVVVSQHSATAMQSCTYQPTCFGIYSSSMQSRHSTAKMR